MLRLWKSMRQSLHKSRGLSTRSLRRRVRRGGRFEALENRALLATFTVTNLLDREDIAYIRVAGEKIYRSLESSGPRFSLLFNKNF